MSPLTGPNLPSMKLDGFRSVILYLARRSCRGAGDLRLIDARRVRRGTSRHALCTANGPGGEVGLLRGAQDQASTMEA